MRGGDMESVTTEVISGPATRESYAEEICAAYRDTVEGIFRMGRLLADAKDDLDHGQFGPMVEEDLPFNRQTAFMFMSIHQDERLRNVQRVEHLPPSWGTLYKLSTLDDDEFEAVEPHLSPDLKRSEIPKLLPDEPSENGTEPERGEETLSVEDLSQLEGREFGTIYADPPWAYNNQGTRGSTDDHYGTMTVEELCAMPVPELLADTAHLHLWTTNAFLFEARKVVEAWGFEYKSVFVWVKPQIGMGNYWRVSHEYCLLGVRGEGSTFPVHDEKSWAEWPRGEHSSKPGQMYRKIERVSPAPHLELFARRPRQGWVSWGNEIDRDLFYRQVGS